MFGPYWSVTRYNDIMDIETNHAVFSSAASLGGITIRDVSPDLRRESFIAMDQPRHSRAAQDRGADVHADPSRPARRSTSASARPNASTICRRGEVFDWVDRVSIELTTQMLAVLFDFPWEDRRKLTRWSDVATTIPGPGGLVATEDERQAELHGMRDLFRKALERAHQPAAEERPAVDDGA